MLKTLIAFILVAAGALGASAAAVPPPAPLRYAEGQVWEYRTRPGDEGSLLRIQRIEPYPNAPAGDGRLVYHISLIGVRIGPERTPVDLPHFPVSRETLDASVIRLSHSNAPFPAPDEGIAAWREAQGGVFTITVAEIAEVIEGVIGAPR